MERSLGQAAKELKDAEAGRYVRSRTGGSSLPAVWQHGQRGLSGQPEFPVLPRVPDRRQGPGRPAPVQAVEMSTGQARGSGVDGSTDGEVVHRGVRWRRLQKGRVSWFNDGLGRWVAWSPGSDAPPLPPGWAAPPAGDWPAGDWPAGDWPGCGGGLRGSGEWPALAGEARNVHSAGASRAARSAGRCHVDAAADAFALQAGASRHSRVHRGYRSVASNADRQALPAGRTLRPHRPSTGQCLARHGGTASAPVYSPTPVNCSAPGASVRVVAVLVPGSVTQGSCPKSSAGRPGHRGQRVGEPSECIVPVSRPATHS